MCIDAGDTRSSAARAKDCPADSDRGGLRFEARQHMVDCRLGNQNRKSLRVACAVASSHKYADTVLSAPLPIDGDNPRTLFIGADFDATKLEAPGHRGQDKSIKRFDEVVEA